MSYPGKLIFIMGVSGAGKDTVMDAMMASDLGLVEVNSYTTRPLREHEVNGEDYYHISQEEFDTAKNNGEFLETAFVHEMYWYGTKKKDIVEKLAAGEHVIKVLDIQGLVNIESLHPDIHEVLKSIFLDISDETMVERITNRAAVTPEELQHRLNSAAKERPLAKQYCTDYIDGSGTKEEVAAFVYHLIAEFIGKEHN